MEYFCHIIDFTGSYNGTPSSSTNVLAVGAPHRSSVENTGYFTRELGQTLTSRQRQNSCVSEGWIMSYGPVLLYSSLQHLPTISNSSSGIRMQSTVTNYDINQKSGNERGHSQNSTPPCGARKWVARIWGCETGGVSLKPLFYLPLKCNWTNHCVFTNQPLVLW